MTITTMQDWLDKAELDVAASRRLLQAPPMVAVAAYHLQQAAEKAIKAGLAKHGQQILWVHNLAQLANTYPQTAPEWPLVQKLVPLTPWATVFRYPADDPATAAPLPAEADLMLALADVQALLSALKV